MQVENFHFFSSLLLAMNCTNGEIQAVLHVKYAADNNIFSITNCYAFSLVHTQDLFPRIL